MKFPLSKLVEVEWINSCAMGKWRDKKEYENQEPITCRTAGYLLSKDKKRVIILQSQSNEGGMSDSMTIPRVCVKRMKHLK